MRILSLAVLSALFAGCAIAGSKQDWKSRAVYQIVTDRFARGDGQKPNCDLSKQPYYCGGDFKGIIDNLDYVANLGFDAIWISPVVDNTDKGFHGYWARDWTKINSFFGGDQGLKDLVSAAHAKNIWVMVDVVANHVGPVGNDFSSIVPFNKPEHYHPNCDINDWNNQ